MAFWMSRDRARRAPFTNRVDALTPIHAKGRRIKHAEGYGAGMRYPIRCSVRM